MKAPFIIAGEGNQHWNNFFKVNNDMTKRVLPIQKKGKFEMKDLLKSRNIQPSVQRIKILEYLMLKTHPSVDEIYLALADEIPSLSRTTVYNTLKLFVKHGIVSALPCRGEERFDINTAVHAHFLCQVCGKMIDIGACPEFLEVQVPAGFKVNSRTLIVTGTCDKCQELS